MYLSELKEFEEAAFANTSLSHEVIRDEEGVAMPAVKGVLWLFYFYGRVCVRAYVSVYTTVCSDSYWCLNKTHKNVPNPWPPTSEAPGDVGDAVMCGISHAVHPCPSLSPRLSSPLAP